MRNWMKWDTWVKPPITNTDQLGTPRPPTPPVTNGVVLTGVRIPFWELVGLLVKISLAAIPAAIIIAIVYAVVATFIVSAISNAYRS
jgi:hypothetical protein